MAKAPRTVSTAPGLYSTLASCRLMLTNAEVTPGTVARALSTAELHAEHDMPPTANFATCREEDEGPGLAGLTCTTRASKPQASTAAARAWARVVDSSNATCNGEGEERQ